MKHSKGPWMASCIDLKDYGIAAISNENRVIAQCNLQLGKLSDEVIANAKLIAAAPELLEALKKARIEMLRNGVSRINENTYKLIDGAIKKATEL